MSFRNKAMVVLNALMLGLPVETEDCIYILGTNDSGDDYFIGTVAYTIGQGGEAMPVIMVMSMTLPAFIKMANNISDTDIFLLQSKIALCKQGELDN